MALQAAIGRKDGETIVIHTTPPVEVTVKRDRRGGFKVFVDSPQKVLVDKKETLTAQLRE